MSSTRQPRRRDRPAYPGPVQHARPYRGALRETGKRELYDVDEWVSAHPGSNDGIPLIGATRTPRVYGAGGHGMWGVTLGPLTGQLLAPLITEGQKGIRTRTL